MSSKTEKSAEEFVWFTEIINSSLGASNPYNTYLAHIHSWFAKIFGK
jgi:hypothetical protein